MKAVLYARVSSERQAEKDLSIPSQLKALRNYALGKDWQVAHEYVDEAESARTANRPKFQEMIRNAKQKPAPFDVILVWKLSRFARNREDSIIHKRALKKYGVSVISINEQVDDSPTGQLLEGLIETLDEFYSANLSQDTRRGMKENAQRGHLNGARMAFGFRSVLKDFNGTPKRVMEVHPIEACAVKKAFELALNGEGAKNIAQHLSAEGFRLRNGKSWNKKFVSDMLRNEIYTGVYVWNRVSRKNGINVKNPESEIIRCRNHHEAIIDAEKFAKVQSFIAQRTPARNHPRVIASNHVLSGLLYCGSCGSRMKVSSAKSGSFIYYSCVKKLKEGRASCNQRSVSAVKFEPLVLETIKAHLLSEIHLSKLVLLVLNEFKILETDSPELFIKIEKQLTETNNKIRRYYDLIENQGLELDGVASRLNELNQEKVRLLAEKSEAQKRMQQRSGPLPSPEDVKACVEDLRCILERGTFMQRKSFLRSFVRRIGIRNNEAEIEYNCPLLVSGTGKSEVLPIGKYGDPTGNRTRATSVKGRCPNR
jgi:site-specific DNA recombinase